MTTTPPMISHTKHIVKSYDRDLDHLIELVAQMGHCVEQSLAFALKAMTDRDNQLADDVIEQDKQIDNLEREIYAFAVDLIALRQPMASDLRLIVSAFKVSDELERMGDHAENIARRVKKILAFPEVDSSGILGLGRKVEVMVHEGIAAYLSQDIDRARLVWKSDEETDALYYQLFQEYIEHLAPDTHGACTHLIFIAKDLERIGDHVTNIAETLNFVVTGDTIIEKRKT